MDILINVVLPLSLAFIMLSLGIGLELADFARVARRRWPFFVGALAQVVLLPLVAFGVLQLFDLPGEIAAGIMLLSFCPGGVTSNLLTKLARGDVALSVSLTAVISLLSILTVPILAAWAVRHFMGEAAPEVSITNLAIALFLITTLPVAIGIAVRHLARPLAQRIEPVISTIALILFVLIVLAALGANWQLFVDNVAEIGAALIGLNVILLILGLVLGTMGRLDWPERKTIAMETGIQNSTMGITLAGLIAVGGDGISALALPSGVYGITMYLVALPFIFWFRSR